MSASCSNIITYVKNSQLRNAKWKCRTKKVFTDYYSTNVHCCRYILWFTLRSYLNFLYFVRPVMLRVHILAKNITILWIIFFPKSWLEMSWCCAYKKFFSLSFCEFFLLIEKSKLGTYILCTSRKKYFSSIKKSYD